MCLCVEVTDGTLRLSRGSSDGTNQGTLEIVFNGRYIECSTYLCLLMQPNVNANTHMHAHMHTYALCPYVHTVRIESRYRALCTNIFLPPIEDLVLCVVLDLAVQRLMLPANSLDMSQAVGGKYTQRSSRSHYGLE